MVLSLLSHGFGHGLGRSLDGAAALARRLGPLRSQAALHLERLRRRCDRALRASAARRLAHEMQSWPDERLRDIGLSRADLAGAIEGVRRPFQWVPAHDGKKLEPSRFGH